MASLSDLIRQAEFLRSGGRPEGTRDIDKLQSVFQSIAGLGTTLSDISKQALEKKIKDMQVAELEKSRQKLGERFPVLKRTEPVVATAGVGDVVTRPEETIKRDEILGVPVSELTLGEAKEAADIQKLITQNPDKFIAVTKEIAEVTGLTEGSFVPKSQFGAEMRAKIFAFKTDPNRLLTPIENQMFGTTQGTTLGQVTGITTLSTEQKKKLDALGTSRLMLKDIADLSAKVNTFEAGDLGLERLMKGGQTTVEAFLQTNPDATLLDAQQAKLASLMRTLGEVGVLTDKDIERGEKLVPNIRDTKTVAQRKIILLDKYFNAVETAIKTNDRFKLPSEIESFSEQKTFIQQPKIDKEEAFERIIRLTNSELNEDRKQLIRQALDAGLTERETIEELNR